MKVAGILRDLSTVHAGFYGLKKLRGTYKGLNFLTFKEYFKGKEDLRVTFLFNKVGKSLGYRLKHISDRRVIRKIDRFV